MKRKLRRIGSTVSTLLIAVEVLIILCIVICRISGNIPSVFGYQLYVIVSPSMEPEIKVGDMIISKEYGGQELAVGDVVTYMGREGDMAGKVITHEIVEINGEQIITKGTANTAEDPAIASDDILAVMVYKTVILSVVYRVISSTAGFICLVLLPLVAMIVSEIVSLMIQIKREGGAENEDGKESGDRDGTRS